jgi:ABC-2 type transport system ATP-binding protein
LTYLSYGKMLAHGTPQALIEQSKLITWQATGGDLNRLAIELIRLPSVETAAPFGTRLHVSGADPIALEKAISPYRAKGKNKWKKIQPGLEDVFIHFMLDAKDNVNGEVEE